MKKSHIILSAILLVSVIAVGFNTTTKEKKYEYASIRIVEFYAGASANLTISYPDGTNEVIELKNIKLKELSRNLNPINAAFNKMGKQGFKLVSSNSNASDGTVGSNYIFIKE